MTEVYGFNEAKSKIAVVDKATQDAKDNAQDTSIANKALSNVGLTLNEKNLMFSVEQADGTSKNASVELPAGGEIETEYYGDIVEDDHLSGTITLSSAVSFSNISNSGSVTWRIIKANTPESVNALYYDKNNNLLKRGITKTLSYGYSGSFTTSKVQSSGYSASSGTNYSRLITALGEFLIGRKVFNNNANVYELRVGTNLVCRVGLTLDSDGVVTSANNVMLYATSTSITLAAGTHEVCWVYASNSSAYGYPEATKTTTSIPSTYKKIIDL